MLVRILSLSAARTPLASLPRMLQAVSLLASVTALLWVAYVVSVMAFMSRYRHSLTIPLWPTPMSIDADTTERVTTKGRLPAVPPMRSDKRVLWTVSSHVAQYVSNLHTSPSEQLTARMARVDSVLTCHTVRLQLAYQPQGTVDGSHGKSWQCPHMSHSTSPTCIPAPGNSWRLAWQELTVSSHVAQYVSNLHTSPREQLTARMARVDSVLTCRTVRLQLAYQSQWTVDGSHGKSWQCPHMSHSTSPTCIPAPGNSWRLAWQELTVSSHVSQYVSNLHTSPREQLTARTARVDSILACRTVRLQLAYQPQGTVDGSPG